MQRTLVIICISLASAACQKSDRQEGTSSPAAQTMRSAEPGTTAGDRVNTSGKDEHRADDTGRNERDRSGDTRTSGDQSESEADRTISKEIRRAVVADDSLSSQAKNAKIITADGVVTLRGPVHSSQERTQLASLASRVAGVKRVENQLEVAGK